MKKGSWLLKGLLILWVVSALLASVAMYRLWWSRERVLYTGKPPMEQREEIFKRAGLPLDALKNATDFDGALPPEGRYKVSGSGVKSSYVEYLLIPRLPTSEKLHVLSLDENHIPIGPSPQFSNDPAFFTIHPTPIGFILSAVVLTGMALFLVRFGLSLPEGFAVAAFVTLCAVLLSKGLLGNMQAAGFILFGLGLTSYIVLIAGSLHASKMKKPILPRSLWTYGCLAIIALFVSWGFLMAVVVGPDDWDTWAQWGPKAKILTLPYGNLSDIRLFVPGSGDYPLLWPSVWAFSSWSAGGWEEQWGKGWSLIFLLLTTGQLAHLTGRFLPGHSGWKFFPAAFFVSMPAVPLIASWGYAEAPLWLMLVCATGRLFRWQSEPTSRNLLLAGLFTAFAACTKNEGIAFALLAFLWLVSQTRSFRSWVLFLWPTVLFVGMWKIYVKIAIQTENHVVSGFKEFSYTLSHLPEILSGAVAHILKIWSDPRQWLMVLPVLLILAVVQLVRGSGKDRCNVLLPLGYLMVSFAVIVFNGENWAWQLGVVWNRLTLQTVVILLPSLLVWIHRSGKLGSDNI